MANHEPVHTLVVGPAKSGTSAVFSAIGAAQERAGLRPWSLFEPRDPHTVDQLILTAPDRPLVVKALSGEVQSTVGSVGMFGKRVMTVRDPRDLLISFLLFKPMTNSAIDRTSQADVDRFVALLRRKEEQPDALSVRELCQHAAELGIGQPPVGQLAKLATQQVRFAKRHHAHLVRYERFTAGDTAGLSEYLGYDVANEAISGNARYGHIARSGATGEFAKWFLPSDLAHYNEQFADYLRLFDYPADVELPAEPVIDPSRSSEYVASRSRQRRASRVALVASRDESWRPGDVTTPDELDRLRDYGANGNATACLRVAQVLHNGHLGTADAAEVRRWAGAAAELGSAAGTALLVELLTPDAGDDPARHLELRRWQARLRLHPDTVFQREYDRLRGTARFEVGSAVIDALRDPRQLVPAVRRGRAAWRRQRAF